jgi:catechol 2,3-dioxygenase-like lactoylglutathione lyase family enzyme
MKQYIGHLSLLVRDYDEAIRFYTEKLNFQVREDKPVTPEKRWVVIAPQGAVECGLLLAKASNKEQASCIGRQAGGRVFLFLFTDDFWRDYHQLQERQVQFVRSPQQESYGWVAVFEDLYGNRWDLIQRP